MIGQTVTVNVDYIRPAADNFPERTCATVKYEYIITFISKDFSFSLSLYKITLCYEYRYITLCLITIPITSPIPLLFYHY